MLRAVGTSCFALSVFAISAVANAQGPARDTQRQIARAQNELNRHFSDAVVTPTLRACWSSLQGDGAIVFDFTYRRSGSRWAFDKIALIKSNLPAGQDEVALLCMQDSVGPSSFSAKVAGLREAHGQNFVVRWTWPVPLPPKGTVVAHINDGGLTGSRDCQTCQTRGGRAICEAAKSGFKGCKLDPKQPNLCSTESTACLSGVFGGGYIARGF
jgi:hypothetical protein